MKVCVIGAGPAGLTTIKQLLDEGHDVTCFEQSGDIGGIWHRHDGDDGQMKAYDSLVLTISSKLMAFSDYMPKHGRTFMTRQCYFEYLKAYAETYALRGCIRFRSRVDKISKDKSGLWHVMVVTEGVATKYEFEALAVCSGPFAVRNTSVNGIENFTGEIVHSADYRNPTRFRGKRVLVVGLAESGADVLKQISDVAAECTLAIRSYSFLLPRLFSGKYSTDALSTRAHHRETFERAPRDRYPSPTLGGGKLLERVTFAVANKVYGIVIILLRSIGLAGSGAPAVSTPELNNLGEPAQPLKIDLGVEWTAENMDAIHEWNRRSHNYRGCWSPQIIFCKNVSFIPNILDGRIAVNDAGIDAIDDRRVRFNDGVQREVDVVVLCTGFRRDFSHLGPELQVDEDNVRNLYKHAFYPQHGGRVALIGFVRPFSGGIPICAEMQARYFALLCSGKRTLPADIHAVVRREREWEERRTLLSPHHTESVPSQILFLDSLAREMGCLPSLGALLRSPRLLVRLWFYPFNQACYRIMGPHSSREAAIEEILKDEPGPLAMSVGMISLMIASLMPHWLHPKDMDIRRVPGQARAPRTRASPPRLLSVGSASPSSPVDATRKLP